MHNLYRKAREKWRTKTKVRPTYHLKLVSSQFMLISQLIIPFRACFVTEDWYLSLSFNKPLSKMFVHVLWDPVKCTLILALQLLYDFLGLGADIHTFPSIAHVVPWVWIWLIMHFSFWWILIFRMVWLDNLQSSSQMLSPFDFSRGFNRKWSRFCSG